MNPFMVNATVCASDVPVPRVPGYQNQQFSNTLLGFLKGATVVIDDWSQAAHSGEINVPLRKRQIAKNNIYGELGEIAAGKKKGRTSAGEITVFDSTGLAIQDVSCAFVAYSELKDKRGIRKIKLL